MTFPRCPLCSRIVAVNKIQPMVPGTINPSGYDFHCEYCRYEEVQPHLKFFGTCYYDMEFKSFVLRLPLQNGNGALMIESSKDSFLVKFVKNSNGTVIIEEKNKSLLPDAAHQYLLRIQKILVFS